MLGELRHWQEQQVENEKRLGDSYVYIYHEVDGHIQRQSKCLPAPDGEKVPLICTHSDGRLITPNIAAVALKKEGLNAHSFRHTHATQLIEVGTTPKAVACRLGHADARITQNLYTHNTLKLQEEAAVLQTNS